MDEQIILAIAVGIASPILVATLAIALTRSQRKKMIAQADLLATKYSLKKEYKFGFILSQTRLTGTHKFHQMTIDSYVVRQGKHSTVYSFLEIGINNPQNRHFQIYLEGFFSKIGKALGTQDIQLNDPDFDEQFMIKGDDEAYVKKVFDSNIRQRLLSFKQEHKYIDLKLIPTGLRFTEIGRITTDKQRERFEAIADIMFKMAERME